MVAASCHPNNVIKDEPRPSPPCDGKWGGRGLVTRGLFTPARAGSPVRCCQICCVAARMLILSRRDLIDRERLVHNNVE